MRTSTRKMVLGFWGLSLGLSAQLRADDNAGQLSVMFYNTYNLFDAEHDAGKDDWTFLPKNFPGKKEQCNKMSNAHYRQECLDSDWTTQNLNVKVGQLDKAVRAATENQLPDLLGLCEVENETVVGQLAKKLGYEKFVMTNSPDERGIDVALLYKPSANLKFVGPINELVVNDPAVGKATRNILEAKFNVSGHTLYIYVNHWPSQAAPSAARIAAATVLQAAMTKRQSEGAYAIAMGDFNTTDEDQPNPFRDLLTNLQNPNHELEVHDLFLTSDASQDIKHSLPNGTYFYMPTMSWNRLDRFFITPNLNQGEMLSIDAASYRILAPELIRTNFSRNGVQYFRPFRADINARTADGAGFSDHFPVSVKLRINQ